ncbi:hypothetical protein CRG86_010175 [Photobacterium leiognathi]|nr:hypothetical protein CRG86_010175 [Photobacterium leiognathi]
MKLPFQLAMIIIFVFSFVRGLSANGDKKSSFITSELEYSNTSAAQRNNILLKGMSYSMSVDVLEVVQFKDSDKYFDCSSYYDKRYLLNIGYPKLDIDGKKGKFRIFISKILKSVIPDKIAMLKLNLLDIDLSCYDYIISSSDPKGIHIATVKWLKNIPNRKAKYIQYWGDPWFSDVSRTTTFLTKFFENKLLSYSDYIIYNSIKTLSSQRNLFGDCSNKMYFLPRGVDLTNFKSQERTISDLSEVRMLYAGDFNPNYRNLNFLVRVCSELGIHLDIYGDGEINKHIEIADNISINPRVSLNYLNDIVPNYTHQIVVLNSKGNQVPGKIYDLLTCKQNVILILDGEINIQDIPCNERFIISENNYDSLKLILKKESLNLNYPSISINSLSQLSINTLVYDFFNRLSKDD